MGTRRYAGGGDATRLGLGSGDRRRACRYPAVVQDASLGWWQNSGFVQRPVRVVDLSMSGCLVELSRRPDLTARQSVWFLSHKASPAEWTEGRIVSVHKRLLRKCKLRVSFVGPFTYESFKRLVYGPDYVGEFAPSDTPEHEQDGFWK